MLLEPYGEFLSLSFSDRTALRVVLHHRTPHDRQRPCQFLLYLCQ